MKPQMFLIVLILLESGCFSYQGILAWIPVDCRGNHTSHRRTRPKRELGAGLTLSSRSSPLSSMLKWALMPFDSASACLRKLLPTPDSLTVVRLSEPNTLQRAAAVNKHAGLRVQLILRGRVGLFGENERDKVVQT